MSGICFPSSLHRVVLQEVVEELRRDPATVGVLLGGSVARGSARVDSDLDVLVVSGNDSEDVCWRRPRALSVDLLVRTAGSWRAAFTPDRVGDESWGYAFLDGVILYDPEGVVAQLVAEVPVLHGGYRVPLAIKRHYAELWNHLRPKMRAVLRRGDPVEIGWTVAVMTNDLVRTVWAINDLPNPSLDLGTFQRHLDDLSIPLDVSERIREILWRSPREALQLQLDLLEQFEPYLGA